MPAPRRRGAPLLLALAASVLLAAAVPAAGLHFLALPLSSSFSPAFDLMGVAAALQARGHQVTAVVGEGGLDFIKSAAARYSSNTTAEAIDYITFDFGDWASTVLKDVTAAELEAATRAPLLGPLRLLVLLQHMLAKPCEAMLANAAAMTRVRSLQVDAVLAFAIPHVDGCACIMSHLLGRPFINISPNPFVFSPLSTPQFMSGLTPASLKTPLGMAKNTAVWLGKNTVPGLMFEYGPVPWRALRAQHGLPHAKSMCPLVNLGAWLRGQRRESCEPLLTAAMTTWLVDYQHTLPPTTVLVGPGSPRAPHPLIAPADVASFVNASTDGFILVAFGSTPQSAITLSRQDFISLARGFAQLAPVRVVWAVKEKGLVSGLTMAELQTELGSNTLIAPWIDYNDVLGHPKIRAAVSHCGVHSVYELAFHGVPTIGVPFQVEQLENCRRLVVRGAAVVHPQAPALRARGSTTTYTPDQVAGVIQQVLGDASIAHVAAAMSRALKTHAKRRHPLERAADEAELALLSAAVASGGQAATSEQAGGEGGLREEL